MPTHKSAFQIYIQVTNHGKLSEAAAECHVLVVLPEDGPLFSSHQIRDFYPLSVNFIKTLILHTKFSYGVLQLIYPNNLEMKDPKIG